MDFKVRGLEFKSRRVQNTSNKKTGGGYRSRVGDGIRDRVRAGGELVILFGKHSPPPPPPTPQKVEKSNS